MRITDERRALVEMRKRAEKAEAEVERLRALVPKLCAKWKERVTEARSALKTLHAAIDAAGLDVSPCMKCGCLVVCLPDGMPMCKACAEKQS